MLNDFWFALDSLEQYLWEVEDASVLPLSKIALHLSSPNLRRLPAQDRSKAARTLKKDPESSLLRQIRKVRYKSEALMMP